MGLGEKAHFQDQIGVTRNDVRIRKRRNENAKTYGLKGKVAGQKTLRFSNGQIGGIS
jgi:hypothetical protein